MQIYYELSGKTEYIIEKEDTEEYGQMFNIKVGDSIVHNFTSVKEIAIDFIERLITFNALPIHLHEIAEDYAAS